MALENLNINTSEEEERIGRKVKMHVFFMIDVDKNDCYIVLVF